MTTPGYQFGVVCPRCGGPLTHEAGSHPTDGATRVTAVAKCDTAPCRTRWQVVVHVTPFSYNSRKDPK